MFRTEANQANEAIERELKGEPVGKAFSEDWPDPPAPEAYYGLAGDIVNVISPHSEADPVSLLTNALIAFGNVIGRVPYFIAEADRHYTNIDLVQVGKSSKARKGSSFGQVRRIFAQIDPDWSESRLASGLSSGEGLIWAVRDPIEKSVPVKEKGKTTNYEVQVIDAGVDDKRLLVVETEFSSTLRVLRREGSTLSAIVRQAWDTGTLRSLTKNSPAKATNAHISIAGHITQEELLRYLDDTEAGNGFANRFLWVCVKRSKILPEGGSINEVDLLPLIDRIEKAVAFARSVAGMRRDENSRRDWYKIYERLSEGKPGLVGSITARAEAQVVRLSCLYALLDLSPVIRREHQLAALALWDYCEASVSYIFGNALGDPIADAIMRALQTNLEGITRTQISDLFGRHQSAARISQALTQLEALGRARRVIQETDGRSIEKWFVL